MDQSVDLERLNPITYRDHATLSYRLDGSNKTATFNITIKTGVEESGFTLKSLDFKDVHYSYSKTILETNANLAFNIYWNSSDS